jgi:hypothetical protein
METWLKSRTKDGILYVSSARENACLVRDEDSLRWRDELMELHGRSRCRTMVVDLSDMDFVSSVAVLALQSVQASLAQRSGTLVIGGVRRHVLAIFLVWAPTLGATHESPAHAGTVPTSLAA